MVALEPLVAKLATKRQVGPVIGQPEVSRPSERIFRMLSIAGFWPKMFDITISNMTHLRFAESTFVILGVTKRILDGLRAVNAGIEGPVLVRLRVEVVLVAEQRRRFDTPISKNDRSLRRLIDTDHEFPLCFFSRSSSDFSIKAIVFA